jgi:MYXO-CTERM domain-containing protein
MGVAVCAILALAGFAQADAITISMDNVFSGTGTPTGVPTLTIDDEGTAGSVKFIFDATDLGPSSEFIGLWFINTAIDLSATGSFSGLTNITGVTNMPTVYRTFNTTDAGFKADGDGYYDWVFDFANGGAGKFQDGDSFYFYYYAPGITAATFDVLGISGPGSNSGPFKSAIHLQGVGTDGANSLWISDGSAPPPNGVPEPGLALLALIGLAGGLLSRRRA